MESIVVQRDQYEGAQIEAFAVQGSPKFKTIGARMDMPDFEKALSIELAEALSKAVASVIGNPAFIFTQASLEKEIQSALNLKLHPQISEACERVIKNMKSETVRVF